MTRTTFLERLTAPGLYRYRVERAGDAGMGYAHGWFAMNYAGTMGAWFPTWAEAQAFADRMTRIASRAAVAA